MSSPKAPYPKWTNYFLAATSDHHMLQRYDGIKQLGYFVRCSTALLCMRASWLSLGAFHCENVKPNLPTMIIYHEVMRFWKTMPPPPAKVLDIFARCDDDRHQYQDYEHHLSVDLDDYVEADKEFWVEVRAYAETIFAYTESQLDPTFSMRVATSSQSS